MNLPTIFSTYDPVDRMTAAIYMNEYQYKIRLTPDTTPILQLSDHVDLMDEFRTSMNQWLLSTFGRDADVPRRFVQVNHNTFELIMSHYTYNTLRSRPEAMIMLPLPGWSKYA